jgi:hypothetical protein
VVINRSTGLAARTRDSIVVTLLVIPTCYSSQALVWCGCSDLPRRRPAQTGKAPVVVALICFGSMVVYVVDHDEMSGA